MNYAIHRISLDVTDDSPSQLTISAKQGDSAKILIVSLLDDKKNYQIAKGSVAVFIAKKSNGIWLEHPCTIDFVNNKVIYTFNEDTVKSSGTLECEIHLSFCTTVTKEDGTSELVNEDLTTASFVIAVHDTILSGLTDETEEATLLPDLITRGTSLFTTLEQVTIPNANNAAQEARDAIANVEEVTAMANEAKANAEVATENAETATANANMATNEARDAIANANTATNEARDLIEEVEEKLENGEFNGVSATHSWNGTTLTVTSASGTSSAYLKGEKGSKGDKGDKGDTIATLVELNKDGDGYHHSPTDVIGYIDKAYNLDEHKRKFKIYCGEQAKVKYNFSIQSGVMLYTNTITIALSNGVHRDYCVFEFLDAEFSCGTFGYENGAVSDYSLTVYYELNGEVKEASCSGTFTPYSDNLRYIAYTINSMRLSGVNKAYFFQDNITIHGLKGDKGEDGASNLKNADGVDSIVQKYSGEVDETHFESTSTGKGSAVFGEANTNTASRSLLAGKLNENSGSQTIQTGLQNKNTKAQVIQCGHYNENYADQAIQNGYKNVNSGTCGSQSGESNINEGYASIQGGQHNVNRAFNSLQVGLCNENSTPNAIVGGENCYDTPDALVKIGNGNGIQRKNAFEVLKDGRARVQTKPKDPTDVVRLTDLEDGIKMYRYRVHFFNYYHTTGYIAFVYSTKYYPTHAEVTYAVTLEEFVKRFGNDHIVSNIKTNELSFITLPDKAEGVGDGTPINEVLIYKRYEV